MKKILLLIVFFFLLGGCADYNEINNLSIITAIGIDYKEDNYVITFEILSENKDKESANTTSYTLTSKNPSLSQAFEEQANKIAKKVYTSHTDLIIISEDIAKNHLNEITDYLLRSDFLRETFNIVISKDPKETLNSTSKNLSTIGKSVNLTLNSDKYSGSYSTKKEFLSVMQEILAFGNDTVIPIIEIGENDIVLEGLAIFNNYKMISSISQEETSIFNLLKNKTYDVNINKEYDKKELTTSIYNNNISIDVTKDEIKVSGFVRANIINNAPEINIKDSKNIEMIEKDFENILNTKVINLIKELQRNNTDILGLAKIYYNKTREKNDKLWQVAKITSDIDFIIGKKGLIYEVKNAN